MGTPRSQVPASLTEALLGRLLFPALPLPSLLPPLSSSLSDPWWTSRTPNSASQSASETPAVAPPIGTSLSASGSGVLGLTLGVCSQR